MVRGRAGHVSICIGRNVYAFGGDAEGSIECANFGRGMPWTVISKQKKKKIINRTNPAMVMTSDECVAILGGTSRDGHLDDGYEFNAQNNKVFEIKSSCLDPNHIDYEYFSQVRQIGHNRFLTMCPGGEKGVQFIAISLISNCSQFFADYIDIDGVKKGANQKALNPYSLALDN